MIALRQLAELENVCGERISDLLTELDFNDITDVIIITPFVSEMIGTFLAGLIYGSFLYRKPMISKGKCCKVLTAGLNEGTEYIPQSVELLMIPRGNIS